MQFDYVRPTEWSEALDLLSRPGAVAKMGGCDLMTRHRQGRLKARLVIGLNRLPGINDLSFTSSGAYIAPGVRLWQLEREPDFISGWPTIANTISAIASPTLRASASFVGNVAQGWSVSDLVPLLQVYDAQLEILSKSGRRQLSVTDYAKKAGNGALQPGELIKGLNLPSSLPDVRVSYDRFTFREAFDLPLVSVAIKAGIRGDTYHNIRIAVVGAAVMPLRCPPAEAVLEGQPCNKDVVEKASAMLLNWAKPQGNRLCSADYQRHVLGVSFRKAMAKLAVVA